MAANLSLLNAMVSDFLNCFNGSGCNHNATSEVTESSPSLLEPSNETYIYFDRPEEMLIPWKINPYFIPVMVTYAFTFIAGVLGNIIVICFMIGDMKKNLTQVFLISLAVADLLLLLICVPLDVAKYLVIELDKDGVVCKLMSFAEMLSAFASVLNLAAVSLERFIVIVFPLRARSYCTLGNVCKSLVFVWSCSIMLAIPFTISKEITENTYTNHVVTVTLYLCYDRGGIGRFILSIYTLIALFVLPFIVMIICYAKVICELWLSTKKVKTLTEHKNKNKKSRRKERDDIKNKPEKMEEQRATRANTTLARRSNETAELRTVRKQVIKMLILVVLLFSICWGPKVMINIVRTSSVLTFDHSLYTMRIISFLLPFIHSCVNPIVYGVMSSNFRRKVSTFWNVCLSRCRRCCRRSAQANCHKISNSHSNYSYSNQNRILSLSYQYCLSTEISNTKATELEQ